MVLKGAIRKIARINPIDERIFKYYRNNGNKPPKEILKLQYGKKPAKFLAKEYGVRDITFYNWLKEYKIPLLGTSEAMRRYRLKGKKEPTREEIVRLHWEEGLNIPAIAKKLGFSQCYIRNRFKRDKINYNIPKRKPRKNKEFTETNQPEKLKLRQIETITEEELYRIHAETESEQTVRKIDYESYEDLENMANLDDRDICHAKEVIKTYIGEIYEDIMRRTSVFNRKKTSTKMICSCIFRAAKNLGYKLTDINTNNEFQLRSITLAVLSEIRKELGKLRKTERIFTKEDRIRYIKHRLEKLKDMDR